MRKKFWKRIYIYIYIYIYTHTYTYICITESLCCTPEINNIANQLYSNIKIKFFEIYLGNPTLDFFEVKAVEHCSSALKLPSRWPFHFLIKVFLCILTKDTHIHRVHTLIQ